MSDWFTMESKFANKCIVCGNIVDVGTTIQWKKETVIKHHPPCEDPDEGFQPDKSALIIVEKWKDSRKYKHQELIQVDKCQRCGTPITGSDIYNNDSRRTCAGCWLK